MIADPQKAYVLELFQALGPAAESFVVAGAQAMKFHVPEARATRDVDFMLDAVQLRGGAASLRETLERLGYAVVPESRSFQFQKAIPGSGQMMRIEFMAPEELKRAKGFRVDIQPHVHARACVGGTIALAECDAWELEGTLPDGGYCQARIQVLRPHALVMLKLLAMDDRHRNLRGAQEELHDREEARTHAADIVVILSAAPDLEVFAAGFVRQFGAAADLRKRAESILAEYFHDDLAPGFTLYEEHLAANLPSGRDSRQRVAAELGRAAEMSARLRRALGTRY